MNKPADDAQPGLNESHRRHLAVSLRHAAELLDDAERILIASRSESPFRKYTSDLAPWQGNVIADHIAAIRTKLADAGRELRLDIAGHALDARHAIHVQAMFAANDVEEMHARYLRGYGVVDPETGRRVDALADALENAIRELDRGLSVPPNESIAARIERLSRSPVSPAILKALDLFITRYHIAELRRPMATLIERLEQRTLHIAVFGRVSSGKSSLLNALLGAPILPVGVTPITAVPARIRFGDPASVRVVYGDKRDEVIAIDQLAELASEVSNPGNQRRVALLQVRYPSPLLREGIEFVDTPGIGSLATRGAEETFAYLPRADLAILLIDAGSAIGLDELSILRLLQSAAIPVQVVISKADLADETSLLRMQSYVRDIIGAETGLAPVVHPVSAVARGEYLLRRWIDASIQPLLDQHEAMLQTSIQRTAGAIREAIVIRLEALLDQGPAKSVTHIDEEGSAVLLELRRSIDGLARDIEAFTDEIPERASAQLLQSGQTTDARSVIISIAEQRLDDARSTLMRRQRETKNRIRELCASAGLSPELLLLAESAQELQHLPLLDLTATLPDIDVRPPMFGGPARLTKILDRRFGGPLRDALRTYANRLHDWAIRSLDRTQTSFASVIDGTRGGASARDVDLTTLREDLRTLAEMTAAREYA